MPGSAAPASNGVGPSPLQWSFDLSSLERSLSDVKTEQAYQRALLEQIRRDTQEVRAEVRAIYQWHLSQGHFSPSPPPS